MNSTPLVACAAVLSAGMPAYAHRLDEYLQATTISLERSRVKAQIRLTPGVAVFPALFSDIDTNADQVVSETEQRAYAEQVLRDLSLTINGFPLHAHLVSTTFPKIEEMKEGRGEIQVDFYADLPPSGPSRKLIFENHHQSSTAAYLVNCLVPSDPAIRIVAQNRNYSQSFYQVDYVQSGGGSDSRMLSDGPGAPLLLAAAGLFLFARFAFFWRQRVSG
jgi:hypothetical protein